MKEALELSMKDRPDRPVCSSTQFALATITPTTSGLDERQWLDSECKGCGHQYNTCEPLFARL